MPLFDRPPIDAISVSNNLFSSGTFRLTGGSGVTIRSDASGAVLDANQTQGAWRNFEEGDAVVVSNIGAMSKTPFYFGEQIPGNMFVSSAVFKLSQVNTTSAAMTVQNFDIHFGVYSRVNRTSASLLGSVSQNFNLSTASSASWTGARNFVLTNIGTHTAISSLTGGDYVFGMMFSGGATGSMNKSLFGAGTAAALGVVNPGNNAFSTGTSQGAIPLQGRGSTTVNALPANVQASELVNQVSVRIRPWMFLRS